MAYSMARRLRFFVLYEMMTRLAPHEIRTVMAFRGLPVGPVVYAWGMPWGPVERFGHHPWIPRSTRSAT